MTAVVPGVNSSVLVIGAAGGVVTVPPKNICGPDPGEKQLAVLLPCGEKDVANAGPVIQLVPFQTCVVVPTAGAPATASV